MINTERAAFLTAIIIFTTILLVIVFLIKIVIKLIYIKKIDLKKLNFPDFIEKTQQPILTLICSTERNAFLFARPLARFSIYKDFLLIWIIGAGEYLVILKEEIIFIERCFHATSNNWLKINNNAKNVPDNLFLCLSNKTIAKITRVFGSMKIEVIVKE